MRKIKYVDIGLRKLLIVTNDNYWLLVDRLKKTNTDDAVLGISLAVTAKSYDVYLDLVTNGVVNPKEYEDIRLDLSAIVDSYIYDFSNALSIPYKDLKVVTDFIITKMVVAYDSASNVFYNKITDTTILMSIAPSIPSEIVFNRVLTILDTIATNTLKYNEVDLNIYSTIDTDSVEVV